MKNIITKIIVFTIIASMLIAVPYPSQTKAADLVYTYWDLWYSISGAQHVSMSAKEGPFTSDDVSHMKTKWSTAWKNYNIWLEKNHPELSSYDMELQSYLDAKAEERDQARVQFQDFLFYLKDTASDLVPQAYDLIQNAKTTGLEMSQELWDAFRQYFDDIANDKPIYENFSTVYTADNLRDYIHEASGGVIPKNFYVNQSYIQSFLQKDIILIRQKSNGNYYYKVFAPISTDATFLYTLPKNGIDGRLGYFKQNGSSLDSASFLLSFSSPYTQPMYLNCSSMSVSKDTEITILGKDWDINTGTADKVYSPFIDYTVVDACPQEVPEVIPWKVLPREITEEETKIKTNPPEDPDDDDEDKPAVIPPIHDLPNPDDTEQESETEEDTEEDTEKTDSNKTPKPPKPEDMNDINLLADLTEIFPFCIPFDISRALKALKKESGTAPQFTIPFQMKDLGINEKVVIDFADFEPLTKVIRSGVLVLYIIGLMWATSKVMKW